MFLDGDPASVGSRRSGLGVLLAVAILHAPFPVAVPRCSSSSCCAAARWYELQVQATRDGKTGLLNAAAWRHEAERELVRAERLGGSMCVLMVDLDHFKVLNDPYGHQAGDAAFKAVADSLNDALRGYDAVGRFGGEEFVALLIGADAESRALGSPSRLRERIGALRSGVGGPVTASIGVGIGAPTSPLPRRAHLGRRPGALRRQELRPQPGAHDARRARPEQGRRDRRRAGHRLLSSSPSQARHVRIVSTRADTPAAPAFAYGTGRRPHPRGTDDAQGSPVRPHLVERDQLPLHFSGDTHRLGLVDSVTVVLTGPQPAQRELQRGTLVSTLIALR